MTLYLDTSALVKLYVHESGSEVVRQAVGEANLVATSAIAYVEARAAFVKRRHDSAMSGASFGRVVHHLDSDWERYLVVDISDAVSREGAPLAEAHRLRAYDAVHLASATTVQGRVADRCHFASWDSKLERAAVREGIEPLRPGGE